MRKLEDREWLSEDEVSDIGAEIAYLVAEHDSEGTFVYVQVSREGPFVVSGLPRNSRLLLLGLSMMTEAEEEEGEDDSYVGKALMQAIEATAAIAKNTGADHAAVTRMMSERLSASPIPIGELRLEELFGE